MKPPEEAARMMAAESDHAGGRAWIHQFNYDFAHEYSKYQHGAVRAVRSF